MNGVPAVGPSKSGAHRTECNADASTAPPRSPPGSSEIEMSLGMNPTTRRWRSRSSADMTLYSVSGRPPGFAGEAVAV